MLPEQPGHLMAKAIECPFLFVRGSENEEEEHHQNQLLQRLFVAFRRPSVPVFEVCEGLWLGGGEKHVRKTFKGVF